jgi:hypothetical protein
MSVMAAIFVFGLDLGLSLAEVMWMKAKEV